MNSPSGGRNGGFFTEDGKMYRIGQISTIDTYGKSFLIKEITELNHSRYNEKTVNQPNGFPGEFMKRSYHFSKIKDFVILDGYRKTIKL